MQEEQGVVETTAVALLSVSALVDLSKFYFVLLLSESAKRLAKNIEENEREHEQNQED